MGWTSYLHARVVGGCLISLGFVLGADFASTSAVALPKCPTGQVFNPISNKCTAANQPGKCPSGEIYNPTKKTCVPLAGQCPPGQLFNGTACLPIQCPSGQVLNFQQKGCVALICSPGYGPNAQKNGCIPVAPTITSINPAGGPPATTVTINGTGFVAGAIITVTVGSAQATNVTVKSPTQITATIPPVSGIGNNTKLGIKVRVGALSSGVLNFAYAAETYKNIQFVLWTGGDDLRSDSVAWAFLTPSNGPAIYCQLHNGGDSWPEGSQNTVPCSLGNNAMTLAQLQSIPIAIAYNGHINIQTCLLVACENQDNWNLFSVMIQAFNEGQAPVNVLCAVGFPLHRFVGTNSASPTFNDHQPNIGADDGIWVTSFPSSILHINPTLQTCGSVSPGTTPP